jgi:hypothetical protein
VIHRKKRTRSEARRQRRLLSLAARGESGYFFSAKAVERLAELNRDSPQGPREYSIEALANVLRTTSKKVSLLVQRGRIPPADVTRGGRVYWLGSTIEPMLMARGHVPPAVENDKVSDAMRAGAAKRLHAAK